MYSGPQNPYMNPMGYGNDAIPQAVPSGYGAPVPPPGPQAPPPHPPQAPSYGFYAPNPNWGGQFGQAVYGNTQMDNQVKAQLIHLGLAATSGDPAAVLAYQQALFNSPIDNNFKLQLSSMIPHLTQPAAPAPGQPNTQHPTNPGNQGNQGNQVGHGNGIWGFINSLPGSADQARLRQAYGRSGMQGVSSIANGAPWQQAYQTWLTRRNNVAPYTGVVQHTSGYTHPQQQPQQPTGNG